MLRSCFNLSLLLLSLVILQPDPAWSEAGASAWGLLSLEEPTLVENASSLERKILELMGPEQAHAYLNGIPSDKIILLNGDSLATLFLALGITELDISWSSIDGGGALSSSGGTFQLGCTFGQSDAGAMSGGGFRLTGGFWAAIKSGDLFEDGFESGNFSRWSSTVGQ